MTEPCRTQAATGSLGPSCARIADSSGARGTRRPPPQRNSTTTRRGAGVSQSGQHRMNIAKPASRPQGRRAHAFEAQAVSVFRPGISSCSNLCPKPQDSRSDLAHEPTNPGPDPTSTSRARPPAAIDVPATDGRGDRAYPPPAKYVATTRAPVRSGQRLGMFVMLKGTGHQPARRSWARGAHRKGGPGQFLAEVAAFQRAALVDGYAEEPSRRWVRRKRCC
jgi:hypothetical protein